LSQNGSCVLIAFCSVERRTRDIAHVLRIISFCLAAHADKNSQKAQTEQG
jgi:hypothetical protein